MLVTVKAAPNPSTTYGETVCVAGISADVADPRWIRLYPINFRYLEQDVRFRKYDLITVVATPARRDARAESWRPDMSTLVVWQTLPAWKRRRTWLDPYVEESMCAINRSAQANIHARSLGLVTVQDVGGFDIERHPGWDKDEQRKIDGYVNQLSLFGGEDRTPLEAPRFRGYYRWRCADQTCKGHRQGIIDWEWVALQRRHLVLDNYHTHKHPLVDAWLAERPRFRLHFTPTSASWTNQVETWFSLLQRRAIQRGVFSSVAALKQAIRRLSRRLERPQSPLRLGQDTRGSPHAPPSTYFRVTGLAQIGGDRTRCAPPNRFVTKTSSLPAEAGSQSYWNQPETSRVMLMTPTAL
jgi:hypothetical protein